MIEDMLFDMDQVPPEAVMGEEEEKKTPIDILFKIKELTNLIERMLMESLLGHK